MEEAMLLIENYWILRDTDPENYYRIKDKEHELRSFFKEKLGYTLTINPHLIRVVKRPGELQPWMGILSFRTPLDYSFLFLILSFLEDKGAEDQFVLSDLTEYIATLFPGDGEIDWTLYQQRRSLVRVLQYVRETGLVKINDGSEQGFSDSEEAEVLYESAGLSRYFLPSFSSDITTLHEAESFMNQEWGELAEDRGVIRRHRVYRRLLLSPMVYTRGADDPDFQYIRTYRHVLERDFAQWLDADLHLHRSGALLVLSDRRFSPETFPQSNNLSDIVLGLAILFREGVARGSWSVGDDGTITMIEAEFGAVLAECHARFSPGWFKTYREKPLDRLASEILEYMEEWEMARRDPLLRTVTLYSLIAKLVGEYPENFTMGEGESA
jgi:uncharacterized protein (TIGR02678 family)